MNSILKTLIQRKKCFVYGNHVVLFCTNTNMRRIPKPILRTQPGPIERVGVFGWFMLLIPAASFGLGVWQVQRKTWKEDLIADMHNRTKDAPIPLPERIDDIKSLEFRTIRVRGKFLHDKELYIGPRSLQNLEGTPQLPLAGMSMSGQGYLVVTPLKLEDRDQTILVNRGWVTSNRLKPHMRKEGQVEGVVDVIGVLRTHEPRPNFSIKNKEYSNLFFYRDLDQMCAATGASPIFLDQTLDFNAPGGPIGGQTRVQLRNEHMSYIITWFSLSAATLFMWFKKFVKK